MPENGVIYLGLFIFFLALAVYTRNLSSMLLDLSNASTNVVTMFKLAFVTIGIGFLLAGAFSGGE